MGFNIGGGQGVPNDSEPRRKHRFVFTSLGDMDRQVIAYGWKTTQ